jgi:hypothetical protein
MPTRTLLFVPLILAALLLIGCTQTTSRDRLATRVLKGQGKAFPEDAIYMGDADGYHYFKLRSIYSYCGDRDYRVPASQWELPRTFRLTDDANRWLSVTWVDQDILTRSRFAYALLVPSEPVTSGSLAAPMPNYQQSWQNSQQPAPATLPADSTGGAGSTGTTHPTTQP